MSESGNNRSTIPPRLANLVDLVPNNEEIIYWLMANDDFCGYFSYINRETSQSCPPFSYIFICCNLFNIPCIYSDYKNNSQKLFMFTEDSVILANNEESLCACCFSPSMRADVYSWKDVKFIGSKQEFAKIQKERDPNSSNNWENAFLTEPLDLLMVMKGEEGQRGLWLDYITYRSLRVDEIKGLRAQVKAKKANDKNRLRQQSSLDSQEGNQSIELTQVAIRTEDEEKEAI